MNTKKPNNIIGIKDIAEYAGVSTGPVDKVLNNRGGVSEATRQKILKAIDELRYKPNILASRLKSNKTYTIAVVIPHATDQIPFWYQHEKGFNKIYSELSHFGLNLDMLYFDQNEESSFIESAAKLTEGNYDGVLMVPVFYNETIKLMTHCKAAAIPVIFFDSEITGTDSLSFIGQNSTDSGYLAADLIAGCIPAASKILVVTIVKNEDNHAQFNAREKGFRQFFENTERTIIKYESVDENYTKLEADLIAILQKETDIKGVFVTNGIDKVASVIDRLKIQVLTLAGYDLLKDNIHFLHKGIIRYLISQQPDKQAYLGIKLLYEHLILNQEIKNKYYLPIDVVMRSNLKYYDQL